MKNVEPSIGTSTPPAIQVIRGAPDRAAGGGCFAPPTCVIHRVVMADGSLEALKWFGLALMVLDHVNKFFYGERLPGVFAAGRVVMPIFGFVLAYNLARLGALERGVHQRMMARLLMAAIAASPFVIALNATVQTHNPWWPLNILFTLFTVVALVHLIELGGVWRYLLASVVFVIAGAFVEYFWMGILTCITAWLWCRDATWPRLFVWILAVLSLSAVNGTAWALLAVPVVLLAGQVAPSIPRSKWVFYIAYPTHLGGLWVLSILHIVH